ncbi:hypothetical protein Tco_0882563 [Tanacetum coccineum]
MLRADLILRFFVNSIGVTVNHGMSLQYDVNHRNNFDKKNYLEHPIPAAPVALPGQQVPPEALAAHTA